MGEVDRFLRGDLGGRERNLDRRRGEMEAWRHGLLGLVTVWEPLEYNA